ncbi:hypothetical protein ABZX95_33870 [Streptomyces sp. NPDC004232]|uniref:hypothetical protein n=1 Tax=Streptomyces sp. NPDC004232 TaxID=3154454 RepID=UPI0033A4697A
MSARIAEALRLTPTDRVADVGSGTGLFDREGANQLQPRHPILCADPSEAMLCQLGTPLPADLRPIVASAEDIADGRTRLPYAQLDDEHGVSVARMKPMPARWWAGRWQQGWVAGFTR